MKLRENFSSSISAHHGAESRYPTSLGGRKYFCIPTFYGSINSHFRSRFEKKNLSKKRLCGREGKKGEISIFAYL
jgi:hypothetical protein